MLPENLGHIFDEALQLEPDAQALFQDDVVLTYTTLEERCNRVAGALVGLGVQPGDRVALMFTNDWRFIECLLGIIRTGAVAVPLNVRMGDEALQYCIDDSDAVIVIASENLGSRLQKIAPHLRKMRYRVAIGNYSDDTLSYNNLIAAASPYFPRRSANPDDVCMQPYTSGSTGRPKGVLLSHYGQIWNADMMRKMKSLDSGERALIAVPMYHKNAMAGAVKPLLLCGGSLVILPSFDPIEVIRAIAQSKITYMTGVPAMYSMILAEKEELKLHDLSSLRYVLCGSAEVSDDLLTQFQSVFPGAIISEGYGLTEGGPVPIANPRYGKVPKGSCGTRIQGSEVKLISKDGISEVPINEVGEFVTRNPGLAKGYWNLPLETQSKYRDGWLYTGDLMRQDEAGFFYFVGRADDLINVSGENVYPKEVVDILLRNPKIRDAFVVPAPHPVKGSMPVAFVIPAVGTSLTEEEVQDFYIAVGTPYAYPRRVFFVDEFPLAGTAKVDRAKLIEMALGMTSNKSEEVHNLPT